MPIGYFIEFAKDAGADGIEILDAFLYEPGVVRDHLPTDETISSFVIEAKAALDITGLRVHAVSVTNDFNHEDIARLRIERAKIELGISLAKTFSAGSVRVFSGNPTSSDGVELVRYGTIDVLKDLANPVVTLALENHGAVFATPSRLLSVLEPLENRNIGLCFDIGNFVLANVNPVEAAKELPVPALIHVKDFKSVEKGSYRSNKGDYYDGCRLGEGVVPIRETLDVLFSRLDGTPICLDLELECGEDGIEATRHGVKWLRDYLSSKSLEQTNC
jgi:sugar phosphate isomerase/epimerase